MPSGAEPSCTEPPFVLGRTTGAKARWSVNVLSLAAVQPEKFGNPKDPAVRLAHSVQRLLQGCCCKDLLLGVLLERPDFGPTSVSELI